VRKSDGLLYGALGGNVMLACGDLEGNSEMLAKSIGNRTVDLPFITPGLVHNKGASLEGGWKLERALLARSMAYIVSLSIHGLENQTQSFGAMAMASLSTDCKRFYDEGKKTSVCDI
jgi:hypothetical protein